MNGKNITGQCGCLAMAARGVTELLILGEPDSY